MNRIDRIEKILRAEFTPTFLEISNFSHEHNVPAGSDSHIKVQIASNAFEGKSPVQRHRMVYSALSVELGNGLHALQIQALTTEQIPADMSTPKCKGGGK